MMTAIDAINLGRRFRKTWALRNCSLRVDAGQVVGLVGPNGAGKSTLLNILVGLLEPTEGELRLFDQPAGPASRARVAFTAQGHPLYRTFSVADVVRAGRHLNDEWDHAGIVARLSTLDIPLDRRIGQLSGGQQAQVSLALALARRPRLLVLDEPVAALDPVARRDVMGILMAEVAERELTVLLSSHVVAELDRFCDHLVVLNRGEVQVAGAVDDLVEKHAVLTIPNEAADQLRRTQTVVSTATKGRLTTVVIRRGSKIVDPHVQVEPIGLEEACAQLSAHAGIGRATRSKPRRQRAVVMSWLVWRQHRAMTAAFGGLLAIIAAYFLFAGLSLHRQYDEAGLAQCVGVLNNVNCGARISDFVTFDVGVMQTLGPLLGLVVGALGVFLGAPLLASELERGTYQWVWTQRVSRLRWLTVKTVILVGAIVALSLAVSFAFRWWDAPLASLTGPFGKEGAFDNSPLILSVYAVFAFALGLLASTLTRRTVAAIALALLTFIGVHLTLAYALRPHYLAPLTIDSPPTAAGPPVGVDERDYHWRSEYLDASGRVITQQQVNQLANPSINPDAANSDYVTLLRQHGIHSTNKVQPYQRAPLFQLIEAGILVTTTITLGGVAFWRITRK